MLTSKQRAYLRGLANSLEPILHMGKGGLSDAMIRQADDALTARELLKGKALETAPISARETAEAIACLLYTSRKPENGGPRGSGGTTSPGRCRRAPRRRRRRCTPC